MPDNYLSHTCNVTEDLSAQERLMENSVFVIGPLCKYSWLPSQWISLFPLLVELRLLLCTLVYVYMTLTIAQIT